MCVCVCGGGGGGGVPAAHYYKTVKDNEMKVAGIVANSKITNLV